MGKRKEIKFMCRDGRTFEGRQDGVLFWIRENQILRRRGLPCYYVAANDTKGKGRTVFTGDHEHFTLEGAKELCQQIMAGEANLGERKARYAAEELLERLENETDFFEAPARPLSSGRGS